MYTFPSLFPLRSIIYVLWYLPPAVFGIKVLLALEQKHRHLVSQLQQARLEQQLAPGEGVDMRRSFKESSPAGDANSNNSEYGRK